MNVSDHGRSLRPRDSGEQRVAPLELFFDLVYVFAVTQLSHLLLDHLSIRGGLETLFLLLAVWWAWVYTAWFTNWFDPDRLPVRLVLAEEMGRGEDVLSWLSQNRRMSLWTTSGCARVRRPSSTPR